MGVVVVVALWLGVHRERRNEKSNIPSINGGTRILCDGATTDERTRDGGPNFFILDQFKLNLSTNHVTPLYFWAF